MNYDVIIIGAGPGGIFAAYELMKKKPECKIAVFEEGYPLEKRKCPIDGDKIKSCINCKRCSIMCGFGGAGAFSDGKYNITNDFGGTLFEYIGKKQAVELMKYVDEINMENGGEGTKLYSTAGTKFKKLCLQNKLNLLDASVRHLGTDINYVVLQNLYNQMKDHMDFYFDTPVDTIEKIENGYKVVCEKGSYECEKCIVSVGRSGSKWMEKVCKDLEIPTKSNRVDLGGRRIIKKKSFFESEDDVPRQAYTMGIKNIMQAKKILVVVSGEDKAAILKEVLYGPITPEVPASILQLHNDVTIVADAAALSKINM